MERKKGSIPRAAFAVLATIALILVAATTRATLIPAFAQRSNQTCAEAAFTPPVAKVLYAWNFIPIYS